MDLTPDPPLRTAAAPDPQYVGPVTLINRFVVPAGRDAEFLRLWTRTSRFFRAQPGFVALRLHRALSPTAPYRFVNVAEWSSAKQFADAHARSEFRELVSQPEWQEFPSRPALYEVAIEHRAVAKNEDEERTAGR
jgi:heme-degrading monooxygenase HmoA